MAQEKYKESPPPCLARVRVMGLRNDCSTLWVCLVLTKGPPPLLAAAIEPHRVHRRPQKVIIFLQFLILFRIGPRNGAVLLAPLSNKTLDSEKHLRKTYGF